MKKITLIMLGAVVFSQAAQAQSVTLDADIAFVTQYVDRGISASNGKVSGLGNFTLTHESNFYAGIFAARVNNAFGDDVELEYYGGFFKQLGAYEVDLTIIYDSFPGHPGSDGFIEFGGSVSRDFGLAYVRSGVLYAPGGQNILFNNDKIYFYSDLDIPIPTLPWLTLAVRGGYEEFGNTSDKWDWGLGARATYKSWEAGLMYYDTSIRNNDNADARVVFSLKRYF